MLPKKGKLASTMLHLKKFLFERVGDVNGMNAPFACERIVSLELYDVISHYRNITF